MKKKIPTFKTDKAAERFVDTADLSKYDLSGLKPVKFEFEKCIRIVAVGTTVARRPPHGCVLAELLHTALASDNDAIALRWIGVLLSAARNILAHQALESHPCHSMPLAATTQGL